MSTPTPQIGMLTERVQLKRRVTTGEDEGGEAVTFSPIATVWARVRRLAVRQSLAADARGQEISHGVVMRFRTDIAPGDRIVWRGRTLQVLAADDLAGRRAYLNCACSESVVTG